MGPLRPAEDQPAGWRYEIPWDAHLARDQAASGVLGIFFALDLSIGDA